MKQNEIIEMAMKSGCPRENAFVNFDILEEFAKLVAAKEREACAKLKDYLPVTEDGYLLPDSYADAIRSRGEA